MPTINVRWSDNTQDLAKNLARGTTQLEATRASVDKLVKSFQGDNLIAAAHKWAVAIDQIGGITKLTAAEQQRANAVFEKAYEKLTLMGKGGTYAAEQFRLLADQTKKVEQPTSALNTWIGQLGTSIVATAAGFVTAQAIIAGFRTVIAGLSSELATLTVHGAAVADVTENFERLTSRAGQLGSTLLGTLRTGTHATITDFEFMKTVNQDLAAGMKLTDQQFGTLAKGAFALAQATGGDVKTAFDTMNDAMLTGRTRALALLTGKIDLTAAEEKFAKSIGTTADKLSEEGKLEAARVAILDAVSAATERLGVQTDGLDERVQQAQVAWANFEDGLGRTIATSTVLEAGLVGIQDALTQTFGPTQQALIDAIAAKVDEAAIALVSLAKVGVTSAGVVVTEYYAVKKIFGDLAQIIDGNRLAINYFSLAVNKAAAATSFGDYSKRFADEAKRINEEIGGLLVTMRERGKALQADDAAQAGVSQTTSDYTKILDELQGKMAAAKSAHVAFVGPLQDVAAAEGVVGVALDRNTGRFTQQTTQIDLATVAHDRFLQSVTDATIAANLSTFTLHRFGAFALPQMQRGLEGVDREFHDLAAIVMPQFDIRLQDIGQTATVTFDRVKKGTTDLGDLAKAFAQLAQIGGGAFSGIVQGIGQMIGGINLGVTAFHGLERAAASFGGAVKLTTANVAALASGIGAMYVVGRQLQGFADQFLPGFGIREQRAELESAGVSIQAFMASFGATADEARAAIIAMYESAGKTAEQATADIQALFAAFLQGPEAVKAAMDAIRSVTDPFADVRAAGFQTREELMAIAAKANQVYETMLRSGQYTAEQLTQAYRRYQEALAAAGDEAAKAWLAAQDAATTGAAVVENALSALQKKRDDLAKSIENEKPEEVMGVLEAETRAQIAAIDEQIAATQRQAEEAAAAAGEASTQAGDYVADAARDIEQTMGTDVANALIDAASEFDAFGPKARAARDSIDAQFSGFSITIPVNFVAGTMPSAPDAGGAQYAASGGTVRSWGLESWGMSGLSGPRGTDRVQTWLTPGETVRTPQQEARVQSRLGGSGGGASRVDVHAHLSLDGHEVTSVVVTDVLQDKRGAGTKLRRGLRLTGD